MFSKNLICSNCKSHRNYFFALVTIKFYILLILLYFCKPNEDAVCIMDTLELSKSSSVTQSLGGTRELIPYPVVLSELCLFVRVAQLFPTGRIGTLRWKLSAAIEEAVNVKRAT